jgi:hypothetical protein
MILATTLLNNSDGPFNNRGKWCWPCHSKGNKRTISKDQFKTEDDKNKSDSNLQVVDEGPILYIVSILIQIHYKISHLNRNWKPLDHALMLSMCRIKYNFRYLEDKFKNKKIKYQRKTSIEEIPSPNPKQGIMLSSSNEDNVFPIIDIACS